MVNRYMLIYKSTIFIDKLLTNLALDKKYYFSEKNPYLYPKILLKHSEDPSY